MITHLRWQDVLDVLIVAFIIYRTFLLVKGTRASQLIVGVIIVVFVFYLSKKLELFALGWILNNFVSSIILVIVVVFQNEIRAESFFRLRIYSEMWRFDPFSGGRMSMQSHGSVSQRGLLSISMLMFSVGGLGIAIVSTSQGLMSDRKCRQQNIGGELICTVS